MGARQLVRAAMMAAMAARSAGLLVYRLASGPPPAEPGDTVGAEVLLAHPGGPLWARRDDGWWSVPKGEIDAGEDPLAAAEREFVEELGLAPPGGSRWPLGEVVQAGGKRVTAFAVEGDLRVDEVAPGTIEIEWPPRSGRSLSIPEVDRVAWFDLETARVKLLRGQLPFLDRLADLLRARPPAAG